jgi:hypothetical protein
MKMHIYSRVMRDGRVLGSFNSAHGDKDPEQQAEDLAVREARAVEQQVSVEVWQYEAPAKGWEIKSQYELFIRRAVPKVSYVTGVER